MSILTEYDEQKTMNLFKEEACEATWLAAIYSLLEDKGSVTDSIKKRLEKITDTAELNRLHKIAAHADSIKEFEDVLSKENAIVRQ